MPQLTLRLGVMALRRPPVTRWGKGELRPSAVLPQKPDLEPGTLISSDNGVETWYLGARDMVLYSGDTGHHMDNLNSGRPSVWVAMRGQEPGQIDLACITVDPYEGEGYASDPDVTVEALPMPALIRAEVEAFTAAHHVDIAFKKRKRTPHTDQTQDPRATRILQPEDKWHNRGPRR